MKRKTSSARIAEAVDLGYIIDLTRVFLALIH